MCFEFGVRDKILGGSVRLLTLSGEGWAPYRTSFVLGPPATENDEMLLMDGVRLHQYCFSRYAG